MDREETKHMLLSIADEETLKSNLSFTAFFIALYENFVDLTVDRVEGFYCNGFSTDETGKVTMTQSPEYSKRILQREDNLGKRVGVLRATLFWLLEAEAITQDDIDCFYEIREQRNRFTHELTNCLLNGLTEDEVKKLFDLFRIYKKIDKWWINEIEIPCSADEIPQDYDPDGVQSVISGLFDIMVDVLFRGNSKEHKELIEQYFNAS